MNLVIYFIINLIYNNNSKFIKNLCNKFTYTHNLHILNLKHSVRSFSMDISAFMEVCSRRYTPEKKIKINKLI